MSLGCGEAIEVRDLYGNILMRYTAQCEHRWLLISHDKNEPCNGMTLTDWRAVLRQLIARAVPFRLQYESGVTARSMGGGTFHELMLTYPLSVTGLAGLLDESADDVRAVLDDLAVQSE